MREVKVGSRKMESETAHKAKPQDVLQTSVLLRDSICSVRHEQNWWPRVEITSQSLEHVLYLRGWKPRF